MSASAQATSESGGEMSLKLYRSLEGAEVGAAGSRGTTKRAGAEAATTTARVRRFAAVKGFGSGLPVPHKAPGTRCGVGAAGCRWPRSGHLGATIFL